MKLNKINFLKMIKCSKRTASPQGFEPWSFGLEVQRAIHCATGTCVISDDKASNCLTLTELYIQTQMLQTIIKLIV